MELTLRQSISAALAVAVGGTGLTAVTPGAPPQLAVQHAATQLTTVAADFGDIANSASSAADLFTALGNNLSTAGNDLWNGLTDLFQLDLAHEVGNFANIPLSLIAVPENIAIALVGGLLGQDFDSYVAISPYALTSWSDLLPVLSTVFDLSLKALWTSVEDLFKGQLANALLYADGALDNLLCTIPATVVLGVPTMLGAELLSLVGL